MIEIKAKLSLLKIGQDSFAELSAPKVTLLMQNTKNCLKYDSLHTYYYYYY